MARCRDLARRVRGLAARLVRRLGLATQGQLSAMDARLVGLQRSLDVLSFALTEAKLRLADSERRLASANQQLETIDSRAALDRLRTQFTDLTAWLDAEPWKVPMAADGPLVSVIMPVRGSCEYISEAIDSILEQTYQHWELWIIDDGAIGLPRLSDSRIHVIANEGQGVSAARNTGLRATRGEIVTYLDADNRAAPGYLAGVVAAFADQPDAQAVYAAQTVLDGAGRPEFIRYRPFSAEQLHGANFIDLNVFAHRRSALGSGFDERLTRLVDWDVILRMAESSEPRAIPMIGGQYRTHASNRITLSEPLGRNYTQVRRKNEQMIDPGLRVLYAVWHWPQVTEAYVRWELEYMRRRGVEVLVWSENSAVAVPFNHDVPVSRRPLAETLARFRPHLVHCHWLHSALQWAPTIESFGAAITVRGHGFEYGNDLVAQLLAQPAVRAVYLFPHQIETIPAHDKIRSLPAGFNPDLFGLGPKDRRLVVRTAAGIATKDLEVLFDVAERRPEFDFRLIVARAVAHESFVDHLVRENRRRGNLVRMIIDVSHEQAASHVREAGVYLHTTRTDGPIGNPISIAEAMSAGCFVLARRVDSLQRYIGPAGAFYDTAEEASQLLACTLYWSDEQWAMTERVAHDRAHLCFADHVVYAEILEDWLRITGHGGARLRSAA